MAFYIPFIDDARKRQDEENARLIKTPVINFGDFGIRGGNFVEDILLAIANKAVNARIAESTQSWDRQLRDAMNLSGLQEEAENAVVVANRATRQRLIKQYPARVEYVLAPTRTKCVYKASFRMR
jgi:hypothetical protein